jgi:hypothetical protein
MVDVIERGEPALMVCHWTGIYWNGRELGFKIFQEVERRLHSRYADRIRWMKLSEVARYWAARELTVIESRDKSIELHAPFACPDFTLRLHARSSGVPLYGSAPLREISDRRALEPGTWHRQAEGDIVVCISLPKGRSTISCTG